MKICNYEECKDAVRFTQYCYRHKAKMKRVERLAFCYDYKGGSCLKCGGTEELEFDHIDPETKLFNIGSGLARRIESLVEELDKCQLLCRKCHIDKSSDELHITRRMFMQKAGPRGGDDYEAVLSNISLKI